MRAFTFLIPFPSDSLSKNPRPLSEIIKVSGSPPATAERPNGGVTFDKLIFASVALECFRMLLISSRQML